MKRRLPNPTLGELNLSLPVLASLVFVFSVAFIATLFLPSLGASSPEEAAGLHTFWGRVALIAIMFAILHCMYGVIELTRGKQRREVTALFDFFAAAVQIYFWYGAGQLANLAAESM